MEEDQTEEKTEGYHNPELVKKIINFSLAGNSRLDIVALIKQHSLDHLTDLECTRLISKSKEALKQTVSIDLKQVITIHVNWYEDIYKYYNAILHTEGMNKSMQGKERLLGLVGGNKLTINRRTQINIERNEPQYDESRFTLIEKERVKILLKKMGVR